MHSHSSPDNVPQELEELREQPDNSANDARSFAHFITCLEDGQLHAHLSAELQRLAGTLQQHASMHGGKPGGSMTIKLAFVTDDSGVFEIRADVKTTEPKMARPRSIMWTDHSDNLVPHNPRQMDMFRVRDVTRRTQPVKQL